MTTAIAAAARRGRRYLRGFERPYFALGGVAVVASILEAAVLIIVVPVVQGIAADEATISLDLPLMSGPYAVSTLLVAGVVLVVCRLLVQLVLVRQRVELQVAWDRDLRERVFDSYLDADWTLQSDEHDSHLQELLTAHVGQAQVILAALTTGWVALFSLLVMLAAALTVDLLGAVAIGGFAVVMSVVLRPFTTRVKAVSQRLSARNLDYVEEISATAAMTRELRVFDGTELARARFHQHVEEIADLRRRAMRVGGVIPSLYQNIVIGVVLLGLALVNTVAPAQLASLAIVVLILIRATTYSQTLHTAYHQLTEAGPYFERLDEAEARYRANPQRLDGAPVPPVTEVCFDQVGYRYPDAAEPALSNVTLCLRRGTLVGVVGPSGAGKSTLVQLLLGLRQPTSGTILVDGVDHTGLAPADWFRRVSFVPQDPVLFPGTVHDNISFRRPGVTKEQVADAARRAHLHEDVLTWPDGYATAVGERGARLSGGQRQRVCIARALVGDPDVVILDEPTSSLDGASDAQVRRALVELRADALVVVVAHRLSTLDACDEILVLGDGELLAQGPAAEVRRRDPYLVEALALGGHPAR